ncbi:hypothetical protein DERP_002204 [Dermatophagoides pteronyssinus]|uniref:Transmembrane protein n=1 Tax=Dermatophagoides pteronyssinus TaxID=6956 RepID=A0ABQ8JH43_DERPT|nr:hypothetical protein DERP_002204 [Dermatophagoides pteronyssinus]
MKTKDKRLENSSGYWPGQVPLSCCIIYIHIISYNILYLAAMFTQLNPMRCNHLYHYPVGTDLDNLGLILGDNKTTTTTKNDENET